jgi:hypothetical protein
MPRSRKYPDELMERGRASRTSIGGLCRKVFVETVLCERWRLVGESAGINRHGEVVNTSAGGGSVV